MGIRPHDARGPTRLLGSFGIVVCKVTPYTSDLTLMSYSVVVVAVTRYSALLP